MEEGSSPTGFVQQTGWQVPDDLYRYGVGRISDIEAKHKRPSTMERLAGERITRGNHVCFCTVWGASLDCRGNSKFVGKYKDTNSPQRNRLIHAREMGRPRAYCTWNTHGDAPKKKASRRTSPAFVPEGRYSQERFLPCKPINWQKYYCRPTYTLGVRHLSSRYRCYSRDDNAIHEPFSTIPCYQVKHRACHASKCFYQPRPFRSAPICPIRWICNIGPG